MFDRLSSVETRYEELNDLLAQPEVVADRVRLRRLIDAVRHDKLFGRIPWQAQDAYLLDRGLCPELRHQFNRFKSMWTLFFTGTPVTDYDTAKTCDTSRFSRFFWAMMDRGVYLPCSQFEAAFVSTAHTDAHIDQTIAAAREGLQHL